MKSWILPWVLALNVVVGAAASAADRATPMSQDFAAALQAFRAADYPRALQLFTQAQRAGMDTPTLHYNLGVTYYRLHRYAEADSEFQRLRADRATAPLANYNLGLIAMQRGRNAAARAYFTQAHEADTTPQLRALAAAALTRLDGARRNPRVQGVISLSGGYDDNVALTPEADVVGVSNRGDGFAEALAAARVQLNGTADDGWRLDAGGLLRHYQDLSIYNLQAARIGLSRLMPLDDWAGLVGVNLDTAYLDGSRFQTLGTLSLQAARPLAHGRRLELRYRASRIDGGSNYEYLTGWRHRFAAELQLPWQRRQWAFGYELELNNRKDLQTSTEFFSESPRRHTLYAELRVPVTTRWSLNARAEYRRSAYAGTDVHVDSSGTQRAGRDDTQWQTTVQAGYRIDAHWQAFARYAHTSNDSNFDTLGYRRNEAQAGVEWQF